MCYDRRMMNHNPIDAAEGVLRARAAELEAAREALSRAETATHTAAENVTRARALSDAAAADLEAATLAAETAEKTWTADQTPSLWTKLSNARGVRDQAELRARSLHVGAETAAADHAAALARVASARADLEAAAARHQRAADVLEGFRANRAAADEEAAAAEGARLRALATFNAARAAFPADFERAVSPALARYVAAVREVSTSMRAIDAALASMRERAAALRGEGEHLGAFKDDPAHDLLVNAHAWQVCGIAVDRSAIDPHPFLANTRIVVANAYGSLTPTERHAVDVVVTPPAT